MSSKGGIYKRLSDRQRKRNIKRKISDMVKLLDLENTYADIISPCQHSSSIIPTYSNQSEDEFVSPGSSDTLSVPSTSSQVMNSPIKRISDIQNHQFYQVSFQNTSAKPKSSINSESAEVYLRNWGKTYSIPHCAMTDLLKWLKTNPDCTRLPRDARTLFKTPRVVENIENMSENSGKFYHFGIIEGLKNIFSNHKLECATIQLYFNVDGVPLHKCSKKQFWPILCKVASIEALFIVSLYLGNSKPPLKDYFENMIKEMQFLLRNGFDIEGKSIPVVIRAFCCDTPARCFIKNVKAHNSYNGCDFCFAKGEYLEKRMTFTDIHSNLRTDESFSAKYMETYHKGESPLERLGLGMVTNFPGDYMHSVCLGVMRKMLFLWRDSGKSFGIKDINKINIEIERLKHYWPVEFNRKPQSLNQLEHWKATELRNFLLYVGPVVLSGNVPTFIYGNFMLLSFGISILLNDTLNKDYNEYAEQLLRSFVTHSIKIYGKTFCVYNVHSLIHLPMQAKEFGTLNTINCFGFENFLGSLVRLLRKPHLPIEQVIKRSKELGDSSRININNRVLSNYQPKTEAHKLDILKKNNLRNCEFYEKYHYKNGYVSIKTRNNCIFLKNGVILKASYIVKSNNIVYCIGNELKIIKPLVEYPTSSHMIFKYIVTVDNNQILEPISGNILYKGVLVPKQNYSDDVFICFALLHCIVQYNYYIIVEFKDEECSGELPMAIVPESWVIKEELMDFCYWPNYENQNKLNKLIFDQRDIDFELSQKCPVNIKYKSRLYSQAVEKMKKLEDASSVSQTEDDNDSEIKKLTIKKRSVQRNCRYNDYDLDSDESEGLPVVPQPSKVPLIQNIKPNKTQIQSPISSDQSEPDLNNLTIDQVTPNNNNISSEVTVIGDENKTYLCNGCKKTEELLPKLMERVEAIADDLKYLILCQQQNVAERNDLAMSDFKICETKEELQTLNESLGNPSVFQSSCVLLQTVGGKDVVDTTRRILSRIIRNDLAMTYNWTGRNSKENFSIFKNILKLILVAVRKNPLSRNATEQEVFEITKKFLRNACDRDGGRAKRGEKE